MQIQVVGIKDIQLPVRVKEKSGALQSTIATVSMQASLPSRYSGSCAEQFIAILNNSVDELSVNRFDRILTEIKQALSAESARLEMTFPYFIEKKAPVTKTRSLMEYSCGFYGQTGPVKDLVLEVKVPVTTLCPCSKEISLDGAHNQRAEVVLRVKMNKLIWIEELIQIVEQSASCELYALLKRPDEKYVTEKAYQNPMFVEDVARKVAVTARNHPHICWFSVSVESFESIHKHSAYAFVDSANLQ